MRNLVTVGAESFQSLLIIIYFEIHGEEFLFKSWKMYIPTFFETVWFKKVAPKYVFNNTVQAFESVICFKMK